MSALAIFLLTAAIICAIQGLGPVGWVLFVLAVVVELTRLGRDDG